LLVTFPLRYHRANRGLEDRHWYAQLTRFLPEDVRGRFEARSTFADAAREADPAGDGDRIGPADGVEAMDALLAGLWSD
jgi:hypothetical protein